MIGFETSEFQTRVARAQNHMEAANLDALLLTTEPEVRYFTGYLTRFWESPPRPWFVLLPATGAPIAVIPSIGAPLMSQTWLQDIRMWRSPDYSDDGIGLLSDALGETVPKGGRIGVPSGPETHLRLPLDSWVDLRKRMETIGFTDDAGIVRRLRLIKSEAEIKKTAAACAVADAAFARVPEIACEGTPLAQVFRAFQMLCLEEGADWVSYLAGGAGGADAGRYGHGLGMQLTEWPSLIPDDHTVLEPGMVLTLEPGLTNSTGHTLVHEENIVITNSRARYLSTPAPRAMPVI